MVQEKGGAAHDDGTAEQSAEISAIDYRANTITVSARALPCTYVEGMAAEFILISGGESVTVPGELGDSRKYFLLPRYGVLVCGFRLSRQEYACPFRVPPV